MNHPFMTTMANELLKENVAVLRFNFAYMEQKKKRPDVPAVAHKTIEAAATKAHELLPKIPLFLSGKSFGGRMSSQFLSIQKPSVVKGIIFFGFPLHPAGKPAIDRAEHLKDLNVPMLFLQGTRDTLAEWDLMEKVTGELPHATLIKFEGADHSFKKGKENLIPALASEVGAWLKSK
jgi:predicted alpha/beta-hydrolase family hydrolase